MNLKQITVLHGAVIRISGVTGQQVGAHAEYMERIIDEDRPLEEQVLSSTMLPPQPLEKGAEALKPLIGELIIVQQTENEGLRADLVAAAEREKGLREDLANLRTDHDTLQTLYGQLAAEYDQRGQQIERLAAQLAELQEKQEKAVIPTTNTA